jgi:hypothetical protein
MMERTEANIIWALEKLMMLGDMRGFPASETQQQSIARAFLRVVGPYQPAAYEVDPGSDAGPDAPAKMVQPRWFTADETVDWLMDELRQTCRNFPSIPEIEEVYERGKTERWGTWAK